MAHDMLCVALTRDECFMAASSVASTARMMEDCASITDDPNKYRPLYASAADHFDLAARMFARVGANASAEQYASAGATCRSASA
jgi:hypothetical protein